MGDGIPGLQAMGNDRYSPSREVAFRIARVFDVPLEAVFEYRDEAD